MTKRLVLLSIFTASFAILAEANTIPLFLLSKGAHGAGATGAVFTRGVVTFVQPREFFVVQDVTGDNDASTSDAMVVDSRLANMPEVGDYIEFEAKIKSHESEPSTLGNVHQWTVIEHHQALPEPIEVKRVPVHDRATTFAFWSAHSGMRITLDKPVVVGPMSTNGGFIVVASGNSDVELSYDKNPGTIRVEPINENEVDYHAERFEVFCPEIVSNFDSVDVGDYFAKVTGVLRVKNDSVTIWCDKVSGFVHRGEFSSIALEPTKFVRVVSLNTENLFSSSTQLDIKLSKVSRQISESLRFPDILLLQEVGDAEVLVKLSNLIREKSGENYRFAIRGSSDRRGLNSAVMWRGEVELAEAKLLARSDKLRFPGREPLLARFKIGGNLLTTINLHLISKRMDRLSWYGEGTRISEKKRTKQAYVIRQVIEKELKINPQAWLLVAGDFNDFEFAEPGEVKTPIDIICGSKEPGLLFDLGAGLPTNQRVSYIYRGNAQALDHMLASQSLIQRVARFGYVPVNAQFSEIYRRREDTPIRASDHNPVYFDVRLKD